MRALQRHGYSSPPTVVANDGRRRKASPTEHQLAVREMWAAEPSLEARAGTDEHDDETDDGDDDDNDDDDDEVEEEDDDDDDGVKRAGEEQKLQNEAKKLLSWGKADGAANKLQGAEELSALDEARPPKAEELC